MHDVCQLGSWDQGVGIWESGSGDIASRAELSRIGHSSVLTVTAWRAPQIPNPESQLPLGVQSAERARLDDAAHGQDVRGGAAVHLELLAGAPHRVERGHHLLFEPFDHVGFFPEVRIAILYPL